MGQAGLAEEVPAPRADAPIPPPILAPAPRPRGHWTIGRPHRSELIAGIVVAGGTYLTGAIAGLATRDYLLCVPVVGPVLGTVGPGAPRDGVYVAIYGAGLLIAGVGLQAIFGPLYTAIGLRRGWKWVPEP